MYFLHGFLLQSRIFAFMSVNGSRCSHNPPFPNCGVWHALSPCYVLLIVCHSSTIITLRRVLVSHRLNKTWRFCSDSILQSCFFPARHIWAYWVLAPFCDSLQFSVPHFIHCLIGSPKWYRSQIQKSVVSNYGAEYYSRGHQLWRHSIVSKHFMEPGCSLPHLQELSTCSYPEPDQSNPHHPIPSLQYPSKYYPPTYILAFLPITYTRSSSPFVLHAPPISSLPWPKK
jgi:hypothetical protein